MKFEEMLSDVEAQLHLLLEDLESANNRIRNDVEGESRPEFTESYARPGPCTDPEWARELEEFRIRSSAIRRILARFGTSDRGTRRFLEGHVDDEWERISHSFTKLRKGFGEPGQKPAG